MLLSRAITQWKAGRRGLMLLLPQRLVLERADTPRRLIAGAPHHGERQQPWSKRQES